MVFRIKRPSAAPTTPASAIIARTATNSAERKGHGAAGDAKRAAKKGARIDKAGPLSPLRRRQRRQRQSRRRGVRHGQTRAHRKQPDPEPDRAAASRNGHADNDAGDRDEDHPPGYCGAQSDLGGDAGGEQRKRQQRDAERQQRGARFKRGETEPFRALRVEVEVEQQAHDAEHRERADGETHDKIPLREELPVHQRLRDPLLNDEQRDQRRGRQRREADQGPRRGPRVRQRVQAEDQRDHEGREQDKPDPVDGSRFAWPLVAGARAQDHDGHSGPHEESVEPEDRAPAHDVGKRAADERSDTEAEHQEPGPGADRRRPTLRRRAGVDRGQGARHRERRREALQAPSGQQRGLCAGDGDHAGRGGEQPEPDPARARANRSAARPPSTMQAAEATRYALIAH